VTGRSCPSFRLSICPHTLTRQTGVSIRIKICRVYIILVLTDQLLPLLYIKLKAPKNGPYCETVIGITKGAIWDLRIAAIFSLRLQGGGLFSPCILYNCKIVCFRKCVCNVVRLA
jgi:hypothetical protein